MKALRGVFVLVLTLALSTPVLAADFEAGLEAYDRGEGNNNSGAAYVYELSQTIIGACIYLCSGALLG